MTEAGHLESHIRELCEHRRFTLYVVPQIRHDYKQSDYLYLLYQNLLSSDEIDVQSLSFWQHLKFVFAALRNKPVVLHYHWFECVDLKSTGGMLFKLLSIQLYTLLGGQLAWTVHNKMPHIRHHTRINRILRRWLARKADRLFVHCTSVIPELAAYFQVPEQKFHHVPHPRYPTKKVDRSAAIQKLNERHHLQLSVEDTLFLMFGNISSYKQMDRVCELFTSLPTRAKLLIAGPVKKGEMKHYRRVKAYAQKSPNICLHPHFIKEQDVCYFFNATDCVLFNYREILTSGGAVLAQSYATPIIAPAKGCLNELEGPNVQLFETEEEFRSLIQNALNRS
ncbi:MAG: glycosyltransferase [Balneolaceae bacterium]